MAVLEVLEYPDARLRKKALAVANVDAEIQTIVANMFETMYSERGVGLAATQVNIQKRIIVMDLSDDAKSPLCAINPEIIYRDGIQYEFEGCISFPNMYDKVERAATVTMRALNEKGEMYEMTQDGIFAVCIQHEIDHLDGILFIDHLSQLKQKRMQKKLEKSRSRA